MPEVAEAMRKPEAYDEKVKDIELIQTHISFVFLANGFVYKIKKPVNFGFLDYSTLEKRKFFCEEEIRLNKELAGEIYLEVVPISRDEKNNVKIKGAGKAVEYAVKMKRLPQEAIMTALLLKNKITEKHIIKIAEMLANFHKKARDDEEISRFGSIEHVKFVWQQNFEQTGAIRGKIVSKEEFDFIEKKVNNFIKNNKKLFEKRVKEKKIKECHGDAHSGNIFAVGDKIYIFDAIEFNLAFRSCDVASEIAFLAMDLEFNKRKDLSRLFVEKYIEFSGDSEIRKLIDFYKCYRAYVRAKVTSFKLFDENVPEKEKKECEELTKKYFSLALNYANSL